MAILTEQTRDELLIRVDERLMALTEHAERMQEVLDSEEGTARCKLHQKDIEAVAIRMDNLGESLKWPKRAAVGAMIGVAVKVMWDGIKGFFIS